MIRRQLGRSKNLKNENSRFTAWYMIIIFLIILNLNVIYNYGKTFALIKLLYIPVIISACVFGNKGGIATAIFTGLSVRPFMILISLSTRQTPLSWITQTMMFLIIAVIFSKISEYYINIKKLLKMKSYQDIQNGHDSNIFKLNLKSIKNAIISKKVSFSLLEYKNIDIINKQINYVNGKKSCELIIINKYDNVAKTEIHEKIAS